MKTTQRSLLLLTLIASAGMLQGCFLAAAGAAGAAGGYEAHRHGYEVQSPVKQDEAGGYKGQNPVVHDPSKDQTQQPQQQPQRRAQPGPETQSQSQYQYPNNNNQGSTQQ